MQRNLKRRHEMHTRIPVVTRKLKAWLEDHDYQNLGRGNINKTGPEEHGSGRNKSADPPRFPDKLSELFRCVGILFALSCICLHDAAIR